DGPSFVTQCPIAPNHTYTYQLALGNQAGTFWYHSHLSTQYVDGIRGALVIYDPHDAQKHLYDVDNDDTVITLSDWYHTPALISTSTLSPVPDSGLINSAGRFSGGPAVQRTRINVFKNLRYRFRIVSLSAQGAFTFQIDNHTLTIIEDDGVPTVPYTVDAIQILAAQRYSVVVTANKPIANYCVLFFSSPRYMLIENMQGSALLRRLGVVPLAKITPTHGHSIVNGTDTYAPLTDPTPPGGSGPADVTFNFTFNPDPTSINASLINGTQYQPPTVPTLLKILSGASTDADFPLHDQTLVLPFNSTIEVNFIGGAGHPFHLHGHTFSVIQSAAGGPPNFINPPKRDVVSS
ncbi:multicopper oxidase, partial [Sphaerobolus stellatus SS14]